MSRAIWDKLLAETRRAYLAHPGLPAFCAFPDDIAPQEVTPRRLPSTDMMLADPGLASDRYEALRDAFLAAAPHAWWRLTYEGTNIGQDFLDRFGCFSLIGDNGAFSSAKMWCWVVYMPPWFYYPWHHHPAEETYLVIAGKARFMRRGDRTRVLQPGALIEHAANQPHAMETREDPVMALVSWRNGFGVRPVLTP